MVTRRRTRLLGLSLAVFAVLAVGVGTAVVAQSPAAAQAQQTAQTDAEPNESSLRVVHASPDAPAVDVYLDGDAVLTNVSFGAVSEYQTLPAGTYNLTITPADEDDVVFSGDVTLDSDTAYTVAASGEVSDDADTEFEPVVFDDNASEPDDDEAAVRVVHLVPDAPAVYVTVEDADTVLADNVSFQNATDYVTVPAGEYTLEIREAADDDNGTVLSTVSASLDDGEAYSALAVGYLEPDDAPVDTPFDVLLTTDAQLSITDDDTAIVLPDEDDADDEDDEDDSDNGDADDDDADDEDADDEDTDDEDDTDEEDETDEEDDEDDTEDGDADEDETDEDDADDADADDEDTDETDDTDDGDGADTDETDDADENDTDDGDEADEDDTDDADDTDETDNGDEADDGDGVDDGGDDDGDGTDDGSDDADGTDDGDGSNGGDGSDGAET